MEADKLGDVCPACGLPRKVFEPYRERVSLNRLRLLNLDLHPIVIHLSQAFVIAIPLLIIFNFILPDFQTVIIKSVIIFSVFVFPFTLIMAIFTGIVDGLTRFKTLKTPLLRVKIIFSIIILLLASLMMYVAPKEGYKLWTFILSILCLAAGVQLGLWGKKLIDVILPGTYPMKKGSKKSPSQEE
ncbi:MAG TPA: hypothetical protein DIW31_07975 [Bacteroidales bacterium]|nr:hypothetical protein [Bacteroidales bacterium]